MVVGIPLVWRLFVRGLGPLVAQRCLMLVGMRGGCVALWRRRRRLGALRRAMLAAAVCVRDVVGGLPSRAPAGRLVGR